ncbi:MAG: hypothetical protein ABI859_03505 [Pseudomonadota bacterium]
MAAANGHGKLWADLYSVAPAGRFVPADSPIKGPEQLAGVPISVAINPAVTFMTAAMITGDPAART